MRRPQAVALGIACTCAAAAGGCAALPPGATVQSESLHEDWAVFFACGLVVATIVYALILFPLWRWRRRDERFPAQTDRNVPLELTYTAIPLLIVAALFWITYRNETTVEALSASPDVTVQVTAFDWSWRFRYPSASVDVVGTPQHPPEMVLPVDATTRIALGSADVDHAFWVPAFLFKRDAIPGMTNTFDLRPTTIGVFQGECAEFCGLAHADMRFTVRVVDRSTFERWLAEHRS